jgi:hypothetical protein
VTDSGGEQPHEHPNPEPANDVREINASESFWDLKASHWTTAVLTGGLLVVGVFQVCIYFRQATIMENQAAIAAAQTKIAIADERPWIRWKITSFDDFIETDKNVSFGFSFRLPNSGKSPASHVGHFEHLVLAGSQDYELKSECKMAQTNMNKMAPTIFPNEDANYDFRSSFGAETESLIVKDGPMAGMGFVVPEILGCIAYKTYLDETIRHSRLAIQIVKKGAGPIHAGPQVVKGDDIGEVPDPYGGNDAD